LPRLLVRYVASNLLKDRLKCSLYCEERHTYTENSTVNSSNNVGLLDQEDLRGFGSPHHADD